MYSLFERYYVDISFSMFSKDLAEKDHVLIFFENEEVVGFSTIMSKKLPEIGRGVFLFSGDTVMDQRVQGRNILQRAFVKYLFLQKLKNPLSPVYWMLISKGYITYLMMSRNCRVFYPRRDDEPPPEIQNIIDRFYYYKFGNAYNKDTGLICFPESHGAVRGDIAVPKGRTLLNEDVQYFLSRNPGYQLGHELACIARFEFKDLASIIVKFFLTRWSGSRFKIFRLSLIKTRFLI